ncbi:MAG: sodium:alanine symporter family protein [Ruminococcaceae bacterium]|nr:sodium:alanine symporter family protein [Oscillospiraceae bacterium]
MSGFLFPLFLCIAGGYTAYRLRFFCFLHPIWTLRCLLSRENTAVGYSPYRALAVALAGTLGVGNITGVAAAIMLGGAGALFWMWVSALCTMLIKYAEVYLAVSTRQKRVTNGAVSCFGGPMQYLRQLPGGPVWATVFCLLCIAASFLQGNLMQTNAAVVSMTDAFGLSPLTAAGMLGLAAAVLVFGGRGRIAGFCASMIPFMTALYLVMGGTVILRNLPALPTVLGEVLDSAFSMRAVGAGGGMSMLLAMRHGCAKGVFTHEAGCGTAPISHAGAETEHPERQALLGVAEVFVDTMVLCTVTGLVLLLSGVGGTDGGDYQQVVLDAFRLWFGDAAGIFLTVSIVFYAFSALVCWSFYGTECLRHLLSDCGDIVVRRGVHVYLSLYVLCVFCGAGVGSAALWRLSDVLTMAMTALNTCGVMVLLGRVRVPVYETKCKKTIDSTRQL